MRKTYSLRCSILFILITSLTYAQDSTATYKKRVLESTEVDLLASYYSQEGNNAAVTGGLGTEELTDAAPTIVISIPMNDDDVLTIDGGISAYTSASSSNVNPFDGGDNPADPFVASTGASSNDVWGNLTGTYSHSSDDRNTIWTGKLSFSTEYDYTSFGFGGSFTKLFNEKNTEISLNGNVYLDSWKIIYPFELRPFTEGGQGINDFLFNAYPLLGNANYDPQFTELGEKRRNSYSLGLNLSQIFTQRLQGSLAVDLVLQDGLLSTPFQRVYFGNVEDTFIQNFQLADDVERLPSERLKLAIGGRLNYYLNEIFVLRSYYRFYIDDWGISSHTANIEVPVKISQSFTLYPSYRYYNQSASDYFAGYEQHFSTGDFYTSDFDLSEYNANQFGFGLKYTDIFTRFNIGGFGLKSIDLKYNYYERNTGLSANMIAGGFNFVMQ
ncbi:DUF3570 domain-containing protein [Christiangramia sp. SM2212]|uniref:DUF3570 domain-containing protein n=1 Tax=Christiangramia sediminicola TaxID=3073267 RepID=A0ABU1EV61_9FLAO|nr:DUF3570 domain-containing protein [Christiangramia sp. SM2212]MDR5592048.1 DUF3570 domain-containing protein [Christiangramia sp. SM2212]